MASEYERTRPLPIEIANAHCFAISAKQVAEDGWILDAGCGTGRFTRPLARQHSRVVGADISPEMLAELRRLQAQSPQPLLVPTDLRALPFANTQFSAVLAVHILHLIADWQDALREIWRVLAPGGFFFLGKEDRSSSAVRDFYMTEGQRRGLAPNSPWRTKYSRSNSSVLTQANMEPQNFKRSLFPEWHWNHTIPYLYPTCGPGKSSLLLTMANSYRSP